jgi:serine/threonine-protein kinase
VAYYLLTGEPVFAGDSPLAIALAHVHEPPIPPSLRSEFDIPPTLHALILQCLAKDPAARPPSAPVLGERLAAAVSTEEWTSELAHAWWELHAAALDLERLDTRGASADKWPTPVRYRPRLESHPTHVPVS